jgi:antitoxin (DNA-binding transcriptional repressor) of toxin-antitoxin stability system
MHAAKTQLSRLVRAAEAGEEVVILRGKVPVARIVAEPAASGRQAGRYRGQLWMSDDFDAPLPPEELARWLGA